MTLTKAELADILIAQQGLSKKDAKDVVETLFHVIREKLQSGDNVKISGFGNFECREKRSRPGIDFHTQEKVVIKSRRVVSFKAGLKLRARLDALTPENS